MELELTIILNIYLVITAITLFITAITSYVDDKPEEIENVWDWIIYGVVWPLQIIKSFFKYLFHFFGL